MWPIYEIIWIEFIGSICLLKLKCNWEKLTIDLNKIDLMKHIFIWEYMQYKVDQFLWVKWYDQEYIEWLKEKIEKFNIMSYEELDI